MSNILGISCFFHDAAAALVVDGVPFCAAEEERFTRLKHDSSFPKQAAKFCLNYGGLSAQEIDAVVFFENTEKKIGRICKQILSNPKKIYSNLPSIINSWKNEKLWIDQLISRELGIPKEKIFFLDHHHSHVGAGF